MEIKQKQQKKVKVLIVHNYYQIPGGEDTVVANEKQLLEEHGHEVILYTRDNKELNSMGKIRKLLLPLTTIYNPRTARDIKKIIKTQRIDIVHVHNTLNLISPAVYYASYHCGVPVVQTVHNFRLLCPGATFFRAGNICEDCVTKGLGCAVKHGCYRESKIQTLICVINTLVHRFTGIYGKINYICLTEFNKEKLFLLNIKKQLIDTRRVYVKPNFTYEMKSDKNPRGTHYLFIGRIEKIKGIEVLLKAFFNMPDKQLRIAGIGAEMDKYKNEATDNIEFLGFLNRKELSDQLKVAKAVIVPSQCYETFGMIVVEAYSACCPVIVGDIGNVASLVEEGVTGFKFKYNDANALVEAIMRFEEKEELVENCYNKYIREFSPRENYNQLVSIYENIR